MGIFRLFSLVFVILLACGSAHAERRVALVIGNSKSVPRLGNPVNDATLVGGMFKKAGFDWVDIKTDLNIAEMRKALREFGGPCARSSASSGSSDLNATKPSSARSGQIDAISRAVATDRH
ncbi:caspase family protein [Bradyrhizobium sp. 38]|nr:caspase family protein [Bradyrhizobium sp. 38]MCK1780657.1 caspase family protein [Bradyrhizobium sp. 132]